MTQSRNQWPADRHEEKCRKKHGDSRNHCARKTSQQITDKRCRRRYWAGSDLSHRNRVQQLPLTDPSQMRNQVGSNQRHQHIAAAKKNRADLQEHKKESSQTERNDSARSDRNASEAGSAGQES